VQLKADFTQEEFASACNYSVDKISFEMLSNTISTFAQALFFMMGGLSWLWSVSLSMGAALGLGAEDEISLSMVFCLLYLLKSVIESAPYDLYSTFVVEERHGFNKQTPQIWLADQLKTNALIVVLGFPSIALGIKIIQWAGPNFWIYVWLFCLVLLMIFMYIFPNVISPMFNKFTPLQDGELKTAIENLAKENKFPLKQLFVVDGSTRSSHSNAYFYGFGTNKRVVLYDTLNPALLRVPKEKEADADTATDQLDEPVDPKKICTIDEIVAILGHELGHWSMSHLPKQVKKKKRWLRCLLLYLLLVSLHPLARLTTPHHLRSPLPEAAARRGDTPSLLLLCLRAFDAVSADVRVLRLPHNTPHYHRALALFERYLAVGAARGPRAAVAHAQVRIRGRRLCRFAGARNEPYVSQKSCDTRNEPYVSQKRARYHGQKRPTHTCRIRTGATIWGGRW